MRRATLLVALLVSTPLTSIAAQETLPVRVGDRVRVTAPGVNSGAVTVVAVGNDTLVLGRDVSTWGIPIASVTRLEVSRGRGLSGQGAGIGAALGGGFLLYASGDPVAGALGAGLGALLGSSPRTRKVAGIGLLIGALSGAFIGLASGDDPPCSGWFCWRFTAEEKAALGAVGLGGLGGVIGLIAGAASSGERWEEVPLNRLRVSVAPQRDGRFGLGASVRF